MTWQVDEDGRLLTADQSRRWLHRVLADRVLVGQCWDVLDRIDKTNDLRPPLTWAACLLHRDGLMAEPDIWGSLNDGLRAWMIVLEDDEVSQVVAGIIDSAVAQYGQPSPVDDGGDLALWRWDKNRVCTKQEAAEHITDLVLSGKRQDILDRLAQADDDFKVMLAAESPSEELIRTVVADVVRRRLSETATRGGEWA